MKHFKSMEEIQRVIKWTSVYLQPSFAEFPYSFYYYYNIIILNHIKCYGYQPKPLCYSTLIPFLLTLFSEVNCKVKLMFIISLAHFYFYYRHTHTMSYFQKQDHVFRRHKNNYSKTCCFHPQNQFLMLLRFVLIIVGVVDSLAYSI